MASNTGPDSNVYQIPEVELGDTFNTWRDITNTVIYKVNKLEVYRGVSGSEIVASTSGGGTLSFSLAETLPEGHTFTGAIRFTNGVTFDGDVTFNAQTFTVNANNVTIDDYNILLGATSGVTDSDINTRGGGGILLQRGGGNTAEWLWLPTNLHGVTGAWRTNAHISISGTTWGIYPHAGATLPVHGTGIRLDGGATSEHGVEFALTGTGSTTGRNIQFLRYSPVGSTAFIEVLNGSTYGAQPFVNIPEGANRKVIRLASAPSPDFAVGTPLRLDTLSGQYTRAEADSGFNAEVVGVVSKRISSTVYEITFIGEIFGDFTQVTENASALSVGKTYYLSPYTAGKITEVQPTTPGQVHKAVLVASGVSSGIVIPFTGGELGTPITISNSTSIATTINQLNRFTPGDTVRFKPYVAGVTLTYYTDGAGGGTAQANYSQGIYVKAQADSQEEAEIAGMVIARGGATGAVDPAYQTFDVMIDGFFDLNVSGYSYGNLTPGSVYFLNTGCAGTTQSFESASTPFSTSTPNLVGQVRKPLFMATGNKTGYLFSYRGDVRSETSITGSSADVEQFLVDDIRSGFSGDLKIGVYNTSTRGREAIRIASGPVFSGTKGITGYVGIAPPGIWTDFASAPSGNRIIAPLDVWGHIRLGTTLAPSATPAGRMLLISRGETDSQNGLTATTRNVIGTEYGSGSLQLNYGVRPNPSSAGWLSTIGGSSNRSSLVVGVTNSGGHLAFWSASSVGAALDAATPLTNVFSIVGTESNFYGNLKVNDGNLGVTGGTVTVTPSTGGGAAAILNGFVNIYPNTTTTTVGLRIYEDADTAGYLRFRPASVTQNGFVFSDDGDQPILTVDSLNDRIGVNTVTPTVALDVSGGANVSGTLTVGTLTVGDFGGATNVMMKPINTTPGAVGHVQPILFGSSRYLGNSRGIPAGTWIVYGEWVENTNDTSDNDPTTFMAKIWTVPTGKYLHIATDSGLWAETEDGNGGRINLHWKISDNAVENITGIASVANWGTGWNTFVIPPNNNPSATTVGGRTVTASSVYNPGYGAYNTYGVVGVGNNTPLGSGYGYIQRLS